MGGEHEVVETVVVYPILGRRAVPLSRTFPFRDSRPGEEPGRDEYYVTGASEPVFSAAGV